MVDRPRNASEGLMSKAGAGGGLGLTEDLTRQRSLTDPEAVNTEARTPCSPGPIMGPAAAWPGQEAEGPGAVMAWLRLALCGHGRGLLPAAPGATGLGFLREGRRPGLTAQASGDVAATVAPLLSPGITRPKDRNKSEGREPLGHLPTDSPMTRASTATSTTATTARIHFFRLALLWYLMAFLVSSLARSTYSWAPATFFSMLSIISP